jgi:magnesium chelatase accessory protein
MSDGLIWDKDGKDWPNSAASRFVEASGLRWHVQIAGAGPVLLLLHGTGASSHSWRALFPWLAKHYTVVVPDLPGHGFTQAPPSQKLSLPGMALALQTLLNQMGLKPEMIVGHSAGAAIAIQLALSAREPPRALIGINAALMPFGGVAGQLFPMMARMLVLNPLVPRFFAWRATDPQAVSRLISGTGSKLDDTGLGFYSRLFATHRHVASTLAMMAHWSLDQLIHDMTKLSVPLLLVVGEHDKAVPPTDAVRVRRILPQTNVVTVARTGHLCHEERPEAVLDLILEWEKKTRDSAPAGPIPAEPHVAQRERA